MVISEGKYATIVSDTLVEFGLPRGQLVLVVGSSAYPIEEDPYTLKLKFFVASSNRGHVEDDTPIMVVSPESLELVSDEDQVAYEDALASQHDDDPQGDLLEGLITQDETTH